MTFKISQGCHVSCRESVYEVLIYRWKRKSDCTEEVLGDAGCWAVSIPCDWQEVTELTFGMATMRVCVIKAIWGQTGSGVPSKFAMGLGTRKDRNIVVMMGAEIFVPRDNLIGEVIGCIESGAVTG